MNATTLTRAILFACLFIVGIRSLSAQIGRPFEQRFTTNVRGELVMLANNILNPSNDPNSDYNGNQDNNNVDVAYIDIDGDPTTFSSSSSDLNLQGCTRIVYAGLYWSAIYPHDDDETTPPFDDYDQAKFMVPGQPYIDVVADWQYYGSPTNRANETSYVCYKDVTDVVTALPDPNGTYTVANIRANQGTKNGGSGGGWILVLVYEDPNLPGRYISTFDGYAAVGGSGANNIQDFSYSGFQTIPNGPVRARLGVGALEGDYGKVNDRMEIRADGNATFTILRNDQGAANNFFNSSITVDGNNVTTRQPAGINALGFDADIFDLDNPNNSVISNNETGLTARVETTGDGYGVFLNTLSIDIIEPNIQLTKIVEDLTGNDITGGNVTLGQEMYYVLTFDNVGNDDGTDFSIRDQLPINVDPLLDELVYDSNGDVIDVQYDEGNHELTFQIPDSYIEIEDGSYSIRIKVKVLEDCYGLRDACSNIIENLAYATYRGVINDAQITDDPSVSRFNNCGFPTPGSTNFLVGLEDCDFERDEYLCGSSIELTAGSGYTAYQWQRDDGNGNFTDISGATGQTFTATGFGTYRVVKTAPQPCISDEETINVVPFSNNAVNPFIAIADEVVTCPDDGSDLPKFFLCGANDDRFLDISFNDAQSFEWQRLDGGCADEASDDCPTRGNTCTWTTVSTDEDYTLEGPGEYRLVVVYQNGCFNRFPFKAYENTLDPEVNSRDILCATPGNITITNVPAGYEYALTADPVSFDANAATWQMANTFDITTPGVYTVFIRQAGIDSGVNGRQPCLFSVPDIAVVARNFITNVAVTNPACPTGFGSITVTMNNAEPQYTYTLLDDAGVTVDVFGPDNDNNYTFNDLAVGDYTVIAETADGCSYTENVSIVSDSDLEITAFVEQQIICDTNGIIRVNATGGLQPYFYAIWSYTPAAGASAPAINYGSIDDIPSSEFTRNDDFQVAVGGEGTYEFVVLDRNNCAAFSNPVEIIAPPVTEYTVDSGDLTCFGADNGFITIEVVAGTGGNSQTYELEYPDGTLLRNDSGNFQNLPAGQYILTATDTNGCIFSETIDVEQPTEITYTLADEQISCATGSLGSITVGNVSGGTPQYTYTLTRQDGFRVSYATLSAPAEAYTFSNLEYGVYYVEVTDDQGCAAGPPTEVIIATPPDDLIIDVSAPTLDCSVGGTAVVSVSSTLTGSGSYEFAILESYTAPYSTNFQAPDTPGGDTKTFTGLTPGVTYTFVVHDLVTRCYYFETASAPIDSPSAMSPTLDPVSNVTCFGASDGSVDFTVTGYDSFTTDIAYEVFVQETNATTRVVDSIPRTGSATSGTITGLGPGTYYILFTEVGGSYDACSVSSAAFEITQSTSLLTMNAEVSQTPTCIDPGAIIAYASGGAAPYEYQLSEISTAPETIVVPFGPASEFTGLTGGQYRVTVRDAFGCEVVQDVTMVAPNPISVGIPSVTPILCEGDTSASIVLDASNVSGGLPELDPGARYLYSLNYLDASGANILFSTAPRFDGTFTNLGAGNYSVTVTDGWGCEDTTAPITITEPEEVTAQLRLETANTCLEDATITLSASGGTAPYSYAATPSGSFTTFAGSSITLTVPAGDYSYYVRDANGCIAEVTNSVRIEEVAPIQIVAEIAADASCYQEATGFIQVRATGGLGNYIYTLLDETMDINNPVRPAQTSNVFDDLLAGVYYVRVDSEDCNEVLRIELGEGNPITASEPIVTQPACAEDYGTIEVQLQGGTGIYQYAISPRLDQFQDQNVFYDLEPGTYTIIAQDSNGCLPFIFDVDIIAPAPLVLTPEIISEEYCEGEDSGIISLDIAGGTAPYFTSLNSNNPDDFVEGQTLFEGLSGGETYTIFVKDANGCEQNVSVTLQAPVPLDPQVEVMYTCIGNSSSNEVIVSVSDPSITDVIYNLDGGADQFETVFVDVAPGPHTLTASYEGCVRTIDFEIDVIEPLELSLANEEFNLIEMSAVGGVPPYTYYVNGEYVGDDTTYRIRETGTYEVVVVDANGCENRASIFVEFYDIEIPNFFTPDGDSNNDVWGPNNTEAFPSIKTIVYDRYGRVVGEMHIGEYWDGTYNGAPLPTGDYWYVIKFDEEEDAREFVGHFTLYR